MLNCLHWACRSVKIDKKYLQLNDVSAYKISFNLSNYSCDIVIKWDYFSKDTVGKQFVKEWLGKKDKLQF